LPALHEMDCDQSGFEWVVTDDAGGNVFAWIRKGSDARARCLVVVNFSPNVITTIASGCRSPASGAKFSIRTPRIMAAAMSGTSRSPDVGRPGAELNLTVPLWPPYF